MSASTSRRPYCLSPAQRRLWLAIVPKLEAVGLWHETRDGLLLAFVISAAAVDGLRALLADTTNRAARARIARSMVRARRSARAGAADFLLLRRKDVRVDNLDADGRDRDLAAIFDPATPLRPVRRVPDLPRYRLRILARSGQRPPRRSR